MITFVTFLWKGWRPVYNYTHVNTWARMIDQFYPKPKRMVCITDDPFGIEKCETHPLWGFPEIHQSKPQNSYRRLKLFDPEIGQLFGEKILCVDLDFVALSDLEPLIPNLSPVEFVAVKGVGAPLNGSMWFLRTGTNRHVWDNFDPAKSPELIANSKHGKRRISGSDQAWMSLQMPNAETWTPEQHGVVQYSELKKYPARVMKDARICFFAGVTKPWDVHCKVMTPKLYAQYMSFHHKSLARRSY